MKKMFRVHGRFLIPGTRDRVAFEAKVFAESRHQASANLAPVLNRKYASKLPRDFRFSTDFALMHLQWADIKPEEQPKTLKSADLKTAQETVVEVLTATMPVDATPPDSKDAERVLETLTVACPSK